jgi:outer membrane protein TolC
VNRPRLPPRLIGLAAFAAFALRASGAAPQAPTTLSLREAVEYALAHNPRVTGAAAARLAAQGRTDAARAALLPDLSVVAQVNRGTGNVVPGSVFSLRGIPNVSGPPRGRTFDSGVWGSTVGASASWDVLLLQREMAVVDAALAEEGRAEAAMAALKLDVAFNAADRFLAALSRAEIVRAARAGVDRDRVFVQIVKALTDQALRPGVDLSRAQAELAIAEAQRIRTEQNEVVARIELAQAMGDPRIDVRPTAGPFLSGQPGAIGPASAPHPALVESDAAVAAAEKRQQAIRLEYLPRIDLVAALWARGSGLPNPSPDGPPSGAHGLSPDTPNWAAGITFTWPILEMVGVRARARAEAANVRVETARRGEIGELIDAQVLSAAAIADGARQVAGETPVALQAARAAETQATARYKSGLATVLEVAEAQRLLTDAEIQDAEARLGVWSALLLAARAAGDLGPFMAMATAGGGR